MKRNQLITPNAIGKNADWSLEYTWYLEVLPHMRKDVIKHLDNVSFDQETGLIVTRDTRKSLGGLNDYMGDMYGYCFLEYLDRSQFGL